jgi:hypothetical protein
VSNISDIVLLKKYHGLTYTVDTSEHYEVISKRLSNLLEIQRLLAPKIKKLVWATDLIKLSAEQAELVKYKYEGGE